MNSEPTDLEIITHWFADHQMSDVTIKVKTYVLNDNKHTYLEDFFVRAIPNCYITTNFLKDRVSKTGLPASEILKNKLPDTPNIMAGDFGEILTLFYLSGERSESVKKIKKWRFKEDRNKAAPHSDVVILYKKYDNQASKSDFVICAEAKLKSTKSSFCPIKESTVGYDKDKTGRLARTLVWLKEKEIDHGDLKSIAYIKRFTDDLLKTEFKKKYRAVTIIDRNFLDEELQKPLKLPIQSDEFEVIVIGITDLKQLYERSFSRAISEVTYD